MRKCFTLALTMLLALNALTGCSEQKDTTNKNTTTPTVQTSTPQSDISNVASKESVSDSYAKLIAYKTEGYSQKSIADFNQSLMPEDGNLSELLDAHANVMENILPDDENYDFITLTLAASLDELYCEQMNDEVGISGYVKKQAQPIEPLPGEENLSTEEQAYKFVFNALYTIHYTIVAPEDLTVTNRDTALQTLCVELQNYVDGLSENEIESGSIRTSLTDKANELANSLSTDNIKLSCEVSGIEIHSAGTDKQQ